MADRYNKIKTWTKNYLFFQDLNAVVDGIFTALNDLDSRKLNSIDLETAITNIETISVNLKGDVTGKINGKTSDDTAGNIPVYDSNKMISGKAATAGTADIANAVDFNKRFLYSGSGGTVGSITVPSESRSPNNYYTISKICKKIPNGLSLKLLEASFSLNDNSSFAQNLRLGVYVSNLWKSSSVEGNETPNFELVNNNTGSDQNYVIEIRVYNTYPMGDVIAGTFAIGWDLELSIQ